MRKFAEPTKDALITTGIWCDLGYVLLSIPVSVDLEISHKEYIEWKKTNKYISFEGWLRKFKEAVDSDIEEFHDE